LALFSVKRNKQVSDSTAPGYPAIRLAWGRRIGSGYPAKRQARFIARCGNAA